MMTDKQMAEKKREYYEFAGQMTMLDVHLWDWIADALKEAYMTGYLNAMENMKIRNMTEQDFDKVLKDITN